MTIYGLDFSHYDAVPSGARVVTEGFQFMTHKAGGDSNDAELGAWWDSLKSVREQVLLGAYWVLLPGSPTARADAFIARLDAQCDGWRDGPFILQVDCERWNDDPSTVPGRGDIKAFCDRLVQRMSRLRPIVYAPKWVYGDSLAGLGYPLWASSYVAGSGTPSRIYPGDGSGKWGAYSSQTPAILQFTSSANALGQTTCDANAYRGTLEQLTALVAPGWADEMPLSTDDKTWITNTVRAEVAKIAAQVWSYMLTDPYDTGNPQRQVSAGSWMRYTPSRNLVDPRLSQADGLAKDFTAFTSALSPAALAAAVTEAVVAAVPQATGSLTAEQVTAAAEAGVRAAFAEAFGS